MSGRMPSSVKARMTPMCAQPRAAPLPSTRPILSRCAISRSAASSRLDSLEDGGDALPAAYAHGHERVALLPPLQLVQRLDGQDAAGGPDRMAERYGTAVDVD